MADFVAALRYKTWFMNFCWGARSIFIALHVYCAVALGTNVSSGIVEKKRCEDLSYITSVVDYPSTRFVGKYLIDRFDPKQTIFVGLGASPADVIAFLQNYRDLVNHALTAINIPFSLDSKDPELASFAHTRSVVVPLFEKFLPSSLLESGKRLVIIDFTQSGSTLKNFAHLIVNELHRRKMLNPIHLVALPSNGTLLREIDLPLDEVNYVGKMIVQRQRRTIRKRGLTEFPSYNILKVLERGGGDLSRITSAEDYAKFRDFIAEEMRKDPDLAAPFNYDALKEGPDYIYQAPLWTLEECMLLAATINNWSVKPYRGKRL